MQIRFRPSKLLVATWIVAGITYFACEIYEWVEEERAFRKLKKIHKVNI